MQNRPVKNRWDTGLLVVAPIADVRHPMWQKMWERAGVDPKTVRLLPLEHWPQTLSAGQRPIPTDVHTVIPMGEEAMETVCGQRDLFRWRGRISAIYTWGLPVVVMPTLRPTRLLPRVGASTTGGSQLDRNPARFQGVWIRDVQHALANAGAFIRIKDHYVLDPKTLPEWDRWVRDALQPGRALSFDIETQYTPKGQQSEEDEDEAAPQGALLRCSFSVAAHTGVSIPWHAQFLSGIRALLTSELDKIGWNCHAFDVPRLQCEGVEVGGRIRDFQDGWHLLESDLPKGLEWVSSFYTRVAPWKHLSDVNPARYAAIDADVAWQNAQGIERDLRAFGQWDLFERHATDLAPILARAGQRGNKIDMSYQQILRADMEAEKGRVSTLADAVVPDKVRAVLSVKTAPEADVAHRIRYAAVPVKICSVCRELMPNKTLHLKGGKKNPCHGATAKVEVGQKPIYDLLQPFNLGSSDQLRAYALHFKHPVGIDPKTKQPQMNKAHLAKLVAKVGHAHPVYQWALDYSQVAKTLSTYMYVPDSEGLIHTTYVNAPSTWRLSSRNYNLQNVGKRATNQWAKKARRQIVARPGHTFVQADSTSIEAVVVGHLIEDPNFVRVAKQSIHAYLVCQELRLDFTPETIDLVKRTQKTLYNQFKKAVYLLLYGGNPYLMHMTNAGLFPTVKSAQDIQDKIYAILPKLKTWQTRVREMAKREGVLQSPFGYRHAFFDVYTFKRNAEGVIAYDGSEPIIKVGGDGKRALAFIPQNCAGAFCRETLWLMGHSPWAAYMPANVSVHDGYMLEVPDAQVEAAVTYLVDILTRPVVELGSLRIGCEVEVGRNWADVSDDNPDGMRMITKRDMVT